MQTEITHEMIAQRAYELYLSRGGQHGGDVQDWLEAERILRSETGSEARSVKTAGKAKPAAKTSANKTTRRK